MVALEASSTVPVTWPFASPKSSASTPPVEPVLAVDWPMAMVSKSDRLTLVALLAGVVRVTVAGVAVLAHRRTVSRLVAPEYAKRTTSTWPETAAGLGVYVYWNVPSAPIGVLSAVIVAVSHVASPSATSIVTVTCCVDELGGW